MAALINLVPAVLLLGAICIASGTDMPETLYYVSGSDQASSEDLSNMRGLSSQGSQYSQEGLPGQGGSYNQGGQSSSEDLSMYREFYTFDQGIQSQAGPMQYMVTGSEPESLIVGGVEKPYDPTYTPLNSFWIQGSNSWTQYIKCPLGAWFSMLALSNGGPATVVEVYPDGYQLVNNYRFYPGYTRLLFEADTVGRHTLTFYAAGQVSNNVVVDVLPYGGSYYGGSYPYGSSYISSYGSGYSSGYSSGARSSSSSSKIVFQTGSKYGSHQEEYGWDGSDGLSGWG